MKNTALLFICFLLLFDGFSANGQVLHKEPDAVILDVSVNASGVKRLKLIVWSDCIIQVIASPDNTFRENEKLYYRNNAFNCAMECQRE